MRSWRTGLYFIQPVFPEDSSFPLHVTYYQKFCGLKWFFILQLCGSEVQVALARFSAQGLTRCWSAWAHVETQGKNLLPKLLGCWLHLVLWSYGIKVLDSLLVPRFKGSPSFLGMWHPPSSKPVKACQLPPWWFRSLWCRLLSPAGEGSLLLRIPMKVLGPYGISRIFFLS